MWVAVSLLLPAVIGGVWSMSWEGALTAFFWGSLVRVSLLHHVTWSINSICHTVGERPFMSRDRSGNVWWLAIPSMGESWHNLHHADPTCARHGVLKGQIDTSARIIWLMEKLGWVHDVVWAPGRDLSAPVSPTLSVHAYSPPLTAMSYYELTERTTLRRKRTELTDVPEGR